MGKVLEVLKRRFPCVDEVYLKNLTEGFSFRRFQICKGKIRALYGHSIDIDIDYTKIVPPPILYHGTNRAFLGSIFREGLKPMGRKKVHLSKTSQEARSVGSRKGRGVVVLKIESAFAYKEGVEFYQAGEVFLADYIPPRFIKYAKAEYQPYQD